MSSYCATSPTSSAPRVCRRRRRRRVADGEHDATEAEAVRCVDPALTAVGVWNFVSLSRPWPSGVPLPVPMSRHRESNSAGSERATSESLHQEEANPVTTTSAAVASAAQWLRPMLLLQRRRLQRRRLLRSCPAVRRRPRQLPSAEAARLASQADGGGCVPTPSSPNPRQPPPRRSARARIGTRRRRVVRAVANHRPIIGSRSAASTISAARRCVTSQTALGPTGITVPTQQDIATRRDGRSLSGRSRKRRRTTATEPTFSGVMSWARELRRPTSRGGIPESPAASQPERGLHPERLPASS